MLVLTRKIDEQILIGEDIKVTLVRVRGNTVRIGIEAPRDVRIVRGELDKFEGAMEFELSDREQAFAHPNKAPSENTTKKAPGANRLPKSEKANPLAGATITATLQTKASGVQEPHLFAGKVRPATQEVELSRVPAQAPLARFIAS